MNKIPIFNHKHIVEKKNISLTINLFLYHSYFFLLTLISFYQLNKKQTNLITQKVS